MRLDLDSISYLIHVKEYFHVVYLWHFYRHRSLTVIATSHHPLQWQPHVTEFYRNYTKKKKIKLDLKFYKMFVIVTPEAPGTGSLEGPYGEPFCISINKQKKKRQNHFRNSSIQNIVIIIFIIAL